MPVDLDPDGLLVEVGGGILLRTPGLAGEAEAFPAAGTGEGLRSASEIERASEALEEALRVEHVERQQTLAISYAREVPADAAGLRTTYFDEPAIEAQVPSPADEWGQLVLATDESGLVTWNFARLETGAVDTTRGAELRTYLIPRYVPPAPPEEEAATRGVMRAVGMKLLKVLVFPLIDPLVGRMGENFASRWEAKKRPYGIRTFTPDNYNQPVGAPIDAAGWESLGMGRALLLVHGTFSRTHTAFSGLPKETVEELHRRYGGRVFAFDHYTMSEDPEANVRWLIEHVPDGAKLELDILCHSRGGLVSRALAERTSALSLGNRRLNVRRIVFVAAPNAGTALADAEYMGDFLDSYTNLLNLFPDNGVTEVLEGVVTVAKMLAVGVLKGLPGLQAMRPGGDFLCGFNTGPKGDDRYYALASNYEPRDPGLKAWAANRLVDRIFARAENDLVVPTLGVFAENGSGYFPIADRHVFPPDKAIPHTEFFADPEARAVILAWLT